MSRKAVFSFRCLPHWGRGTAPAVDRVLSFILDLRRISPLIFHTARALSGSLRSPPSPRGEGFVSRKAVFSYHCLPHWGRGTASAVDRVLSYIVDLRRISLVLFHTARTLSGSLRSPPSPRGEGFVSRKAVFSYHCLPHWGRGTASAVDRVLSQTAHLSPFLFHLYHLLETIFPALFHTARTLSGSLRSPPSPRGEGFVSGIPLPPSNLRPFGAPPSIGRRECPREPLPLEGAAEQSEAGLASFWGGEAAAKSLKTGIRD